MSNFGKQVSVIVEIDVEYCGLEYGVGACPAVLGTDSATKCYNFYNGCPVKASFSKTTKTLRYSMGQLHGVRDVVIYPFLKSVSTNATTITLGNVDERLGSLGKRARITVTLDDQRESDIDLDKYVGERSYNAEEQGTHFGRLHARWPFYYGRALRVLTGYVGDPLSSYHVRSYIITKWAGPTGSSVTITAQDPLKLADEDLATAPVASGGVLATDIGTGLETFQINPEGIGSDYPSEGYASIGSEIVSYTRSFRNITLTGRGLGGSEIAEHDAGDSFQQCIRYDKALVSDVIYDQLVNYAGLTAAQVPNADHESEIDRWASTTRLSAFLPYPKGVATHLGRIAQLGFMIWWGEVDQEVKVRTNRPPDYDETVASATDAAHIIENTMSVRDLSDLTITQVHIYHGVINYTDDLESTDNYKVVTVTTDLAAQGELEHNQTSILKIYCPWFGNDGNSGIAGIIGARLLNRFRNTPKEATFTADIKDRDSLDVAALVNVETYAIQNEDGSTSVEQMQVMSVQPTPESDYVTITAQSYRFDERYGFVTENSRSVYGVATDEEKRKGTYLSSGDSDFADGQPCYRLY